MPPLFSAHNILLIATRQIGDVLLVTPLLRSLRHSYPQSQIDVLVYAHKGDMLIGNPDYNQLISVAEHPNLSQYKHLLTRITRHYDLGISTLPGDRPLVYTFLAAKQRIAIVPKPRWQDNWKRLLTQRWTELDNTQTHTVLQNLRLADLLNIPRTYSIIPPKSAEPTEQLMQRHIPKTWQQHPFVLLHLLPQWHYKRWSQPNWQHLITYLIQQGLHIIITGSSSPTEQTYLTQTLHSLKGPILNLAGRLQFSEIAQLLPKSQFYVGPDTAVTHLAAATGTPTVALYGPTNPLKWSPWPLGHSQNCNPFQHHGTQKVGNVLLIQAPGDCVPCHQEGCDRHKQSHSQCLNQLSSSTVIQHIHQAQFL